MMNRAVVAASVAVVAVLAVGGGLLATSSDAPSAVSCSTISHVGDTLSVQCADGVWHTDGTFVPNTTTTIPATTTTRASTTTTAAPTTTTNSPTTTTTIPGATLSCLASAGATNTFLLNDFLGDPNQINSPTPVFTLVGNGGSSSYTVKVDSTVLPGTYQNTPRTDSVCIKTPPLAEGSHTISAVEILPTPEQVTPYTFLVDTTPPAPPVITSASYISPYVRMSGTGIATFNVKVYEAGGLRGGSSVGGTGLWSAAISCPPGSHVLYAIQTDRAGNQSVQSNAVTVVVPG